MNTFDQMAAEGNLMGIAMQIPALTIQLKQTLDQHHGDPTTAARNAAMTRAWADAAPESRAALLLTMAWHSRTATLQFRDGADYAESLHQYAAEFTGDQDAFHGPRFPGGPLPGHAGALAGSIGFDTDDNAVSLEAVLVLMAALPTLAQEA
ncbi:MAG: hypothetical protein ACJ786_30320 [Catenulispora sp.]